MTPRTIPASEFHSTWSPRLNILDIAFSPFGSDLYPEMTSSYESLGSFLVTGHELPGWNGFNPQSHRLLAALAARASTASYLINGGPITDPSIRQLSSGRGRFRPARPSASPL